MTEQYRFKGREETEWSDWTDRYTPEGLDNIEYPDDDEWLEYQHRQVQRTEDGEDVLVEHVWHDIVTEIPNLYGPTTVPLRDGVGGPKIGDATVMPDGTVRATIEDELTAAKLRDPSLGLGQFSYINISAGGKTVAEEISKVHETVVPLGERDNTRAYKEALLLTEDPVKDLKDAGYITKDSGVRAEYASGMVRDTQDGKPRFDLTMPVSDETEVALFFALFTEQAKREGRLHDADTTAMTTLVDWYEHPSRRLALKVLAEIEAVVADEYPVVEYKDLLLTRWAALMGRGAEKYGDRNWEKSDGTDGAFDRARGSALRHGMQWWNHQTDEDHAAAVCFNVGAVDYYKDRQAQL